MLRFLISAFLVICTQPACADFWSDLRDGTVDIITAPTRMTIDVLKGDNPVDTAEGTIKSQGQILKSGVDEISRVNSFVYGIPAPLLERSLGRDWARAYNSLTASQRIQTEIGLTGGRYFADCIATGQCQVERAVAMPLAAALRDAYKSNIGQARSPNQQFLQQAAATGVVPLWVLQNTRIITTGTPDISVPGLLNSGFRAQGGEHAVTIANLLFFSRQPNANNCSDLSWIMHELFHVEQYFRFSSHPLEAIDGFATAYIQSYGQIEREADEIGKIRAQQYSNFYGLGCRY